MELYSYLTNEWYSPLKDQILIHAVRELLGLPYTQITRGITTFNISSAVCSTFAHFSIGRQTTGDVGTCGVLTRELISYLISSNKLSEENIIEKVNEVWEREYKADFPKGMK